MRILHFLNSHRPHGGDIIGHVTALATAQGLAGHEVGIVCIDTGNHLINTPLLEKAEKHCTLGVVSLHVNLANIATKIATSLQANIEAVQLAGKLRPQIVHGHGVEGGRLAAQHHKNMTQKNADIKCIYSPHNAPLEAASPYNWPLQFPEKQGWKHTSGIIFGSKAYQQAYEIQNGTPSCPTRLIHEGLDETSFAPRQIIDMASDFLFVGPFVEHSGVETLVQVLARLKKDHSTGALLVGSGPREKQIRAQVDRYGLKHNIFFNASLDAKTAFLKGGCLVLTDNHNAIPMIILQAAAAGVPMILTNSAGIAEFIGDIKMPLVVPGDTDALQKQMISYLQQPQLFLGRAAALKKRVSERFTLKRMADETEQFYTTRATR